MASKLLRLDKAVSHSFEVSRKEAVFLIRDGAVSVAGEIVCDPAFKISADTPLELDGNEFTAQETMRKRVFMLNKPQGYVCADRDNRYLTVSSIFSGESHCFNLHCAKLDVDTTALLSSPMMVILSHKIASPRANVEKVYIACVKNPIEER